MVLVDFFDKAEDHLLKFAVIIAKKDNQWVLCKHRDRDTLEVPGGHREIGEEILATARRELYEETGAVEYKIEPICVYRVLRQEEDQGSFGMLYYAECYKFDPLPDLEIEKVIFMDDLPNNWTYPDIQPRLLERFIQYINNCSV
ncbi:MAG: hypothetical protein K0S47_3372 [Herbinix sp.]|jgi:8-oxo-dGTP diphosphatase|nr:hypothetical protein [Herbinix sp.]